LQVNPFGKILGQLHCGDTQLVQTLLRLLNHMTVDMESTVEICQIGGIPVVVSLLSPSDGGVEAILTPSRVSEIQSVALLMCRMAEDNESAYQMRQCNAVYLLGKLLLHTFCTDPAFQEEAALLKAHLFMALRFLFSMERNRKVFKRLFPPNLFATFIDIGHYQFGLPQYTDLVQRWDKLSEKAVQSMAAALEDINLFKGDAQRRVRDYVILELLGSGAFGAVYKARRAGSEMLIALKELPLSDVGLFGATTEEKSAGVGTLTSEVEILSQLSHPNIVAYYESFVEEGCLWIAMELVEGLSLLDYTCSLAEKGRRMREAEIWQVFVGLVMALDHCHREKRIVHRDLTPGNIVLGHGSEGLRQVKVTDFGLAKQRSGATDAMMQSMVGTMPYTCPEIIQQEGYTEKADIWSLGCVLYHMCMLRGPFEGSNPLQLASKIVEGSYEAVCGPAAGEAYSGELTRMVAALLTTDPARRPSISQVSSLCSAHLLRELTALSVQDNKLRATLEYERKKRREDKEVKHRKEEAYKRLVSFGRASTTEVAAFQEAGPSVAANPHLSALQTRAGSAKRLPPLHGAAASGAASPMLPGSPVVRRLDGGGSSDKMEGSIKRIPLRLSSKDDLAGAGGGRDTIKINQARLSSPLLPLFHHTLHTPLLSWYL
jgi:NIMA (never in mitosis gene a)-related kinase